jgi:hypothetical protein
MYTDGYKAQNGTGYAIISYQSIIKVKLHHLFFFFFYELNVLKYVILHNSTMIETDVLQFLRLCK